MADLLLKSEITNDMLVRGYAGMTDSQVVTDLETAYRASAQTDKWSMLDAGMARRFLHEAGLPSGASRYQELIIAQTDTSNSAWLQGLALDAMNLIKQNLLALDYGDPADAAFINALISGVWDAATLTVLKDNYLSKTITRSEDLGIEPRPVSVGNVMEARLP